MKILSFIGVLIFLSRSCVTALLSTDKSQGHTFWVTDSTDREQDCKNRASCKTLDEYHQHNNSIFSTSHSTWIFLKGNHTASFALEVTETEHIVFKGEREDCCEVIFKNGFHITSSQSIKIQMLKFRSYELFSLLKYCLMVHKLALVLQLSQVENVTLSKLKVDNWGIIITDPSGLYEVTASNFTNTTLCVKKESNEINYCRSPALFKMTMTIVDNSYIFIEILQIGSKYVIDNCLLNMQQCLKVHLTYCSLFDTKFIFYGPKEQYYESNFNNSSMLERELESFLQMENCKFFGSNQQGGLIVKKGIVLINDCTFDNTCTNRHYMQSEIQILSSMVYVQGNNSISGYVSHLSGILKVFNSTLFIHNNSYLEIRNNSGRYSGGIHGCFLPDLPVHSYRECKRFYSAHPSLCFFQLVDQQGHLLTKGEIPYFKGSLVLENNTNKIGYHGNNIYAGHISNCTIQTKDGDVTANQIFLQMFINLPSWESKDISSPPYLICLYKKQNCSNQFIIDCNNETNFTLFPGEKLTLYVSIIGDFNQPVYHYLELLHDSNVRFDLLSEAELSICQEYHISRIQRENVTVTLKPKDYSMNEVYHNINIRVLQKCPPGFLLQGADNSNQSLKWCSCNSFLNKSHFRCSIIQGEPKYQQEKGYMWIGLKEYFLTISEYCPIFYYNQRKLKHGVTLSDIKSDNLTTQCQHKNKRQGFLCSECPDGHSSTFGGFKCTVCEKSWLLLLIIYSLAGPALLAFLFLFNLTVVPGTIQGVILYANVMYLYDDFLQENARGILYAIISSLNLGPLKNICFYGGLDECSIAMLKYAFPIYLLLLAGLVIFGAQILKLKLFTVQFIVKRCVPVLATVMILTYLNLVHLVWISLRYNIVHYVSQDCIFSEVVWLYQPKLHYFQGKHLALGLLAIVVSIIYIFPLTIVVLFGEPLRRRVIRKTWFSHFIDVFHGAYRKPFGFWLGLRLVFRIVLVSLQSVILHNDIVKYTLSVLCIVIFFLCLENLAKPLRNCYNFDISKEEAIKSRKILKLLQRLQGFIKWLMHPQVLDNLFLLNIIYICIVIVVTRDDNISQSFGCNISITVASI